VHLVLITYSTLFYRLAFNLHNVSITGIAATVRIVPSGPIEGISVGTPQDIQCRVRTASGVELSSVMISWIGPEGDTITNNSRVTISQTSGSGVKYYSSLQFMYLTVEDEGTYACNVRILKASTSESLQIRDLVGKLL